MVKKGMFVILGIILCISNQEVTAAQWDQDDNIEKAVIACKKSADSSGRNNLRKVVSNCYANNRKNNTPQKFEYCAALDLCAYYLNFNMEKLGYKAQEYFVLDSVSKRVSDGLASFGLSEQQVVDANSFIANTTGKWFKAHFSKENSAREKAELSETDLGLIFKGSDAFYDSYKREGIMGASTESQKLMKSYDKRVKTKKTNKYEELLHLAGFDLSAYLIDSLFGSTIEYFSDPEVNGRLKVRFLKLGVTESKYNQLLDIAIPELQKHLLQKVQK